MEQEQMPSFAAVLQHYRRQVGLTQEALAERAHLSVRGISDLERGVRHLPRPHTVHLLADALHLSAADRAAFERAARPPTGLATAPPRPRPLPTPLPVLLGRSTDLAALRVLLAAEQRLVTIVGPPGVGKTCVALHAAHEVSATFRDGVCFVPLGAVTNATQVLAAVLAALGLQELGEQTLLDTLTTFLHHKHLLLVLNNFEHVLPAAPTLAPVLQQAAQLTVLVTSRTPLQLESEQQYHLRPLALLPHHAATAATLMTCPATALFVQRARAVHPAFVITDATAPVIAAICTRLDGLPLAIELAAARSNVLTPPALLRHLDACLDLLHLPRADGPDRHHTLRQAIGWSYRLLDATAQALLRRLSVFVGGAPLSAVDAVCMQQDVDGRGPINAGDHHALSTPMLLDQLTTLVQHHLLQQMPGRDQEPRFTMLETIRAFAAEQLEADAEEATRTRQRHRAYYLSVVEAADAALQQEEQHPWFDRLEAEYPNIRAALQWRLPSGIDAEHRVRLATAVSTFWLQRGHLGEGRAWLKDALTGAGAGAVPPARRARALAQASRLARAQSDLADATTLAEASRALAHSSGDAQSEAMALYTLGFVAFMQAQHDQARAYLEASAALAATLGDMRQYAAAINRLGHVAHFQGHAAEAQALFEQELVLVRANHDTVGTTRALIALGSLQSRHKAYDAAALLLHEGLALAQAGGYTTYIFVALNNLGELARMQGNDHQAMTYYTACLTLCHNQGRRAGIALELNNCGWIAVRQGDARRAAESLAQSLALWRELDDTHGSALAVAGCAGVAWMVAHLQRAAYLLGAADAMFASIGAVMDAADQIEYERIMVAARTHLPRTTFDTAYTNGRTVRADQAIGEAQSFAHAVAAGLITQPSAPKA